MRAVVDGRGWMSAVALAVIATPVAQAAAQAVPPQRDYPQRDFQAPPLPAEAYTQPPYAMTPPYSAPPTGYDDRDAPPPPPPPGYDGRDPPPPPPGYQPQGDTAAQAEQDRRYAAYVDDWSRRYCVKARSNAGAGAVIGGVFGALLGSSVAGWRDRGTGALVGGLAGAGAGAAIGSSSVNATSPGCPPGFVVRRDAPAFYYEGYREPYVYAAPEWYRPWVFYGGAWTYRPYPYHSWYYGHYGFRGPGYGYGYRGGYRGRGYRRW